MRLAHLRVASTPRHPRTIRHRDTGVLVGVHAWGVPKRVLVDEDDTVAVPAQDVGREKPRNASPDDHSGVEHREYVSSLFWI